MYGSLLFRLSWERYSDGLAARQDENGEKDTLLRGRTGKQHYLGLNFAEMEFDFPGKSRY